MRRRWLVSAVCFLALGAVSTVALCWLVAGVRVEVGRWVWPPDGEEYAADWGRWTSIEIRAWSGTRRGLYPDDGTYFERTSFDPPPAWSRGRDDPRDWHDTYFEGSYGWPWDAMWYRADLTSERFLMSDERIFGGMPIRTVGSLRLLMPPHPTFDSRGLMSDSPPALPLRLTWGFAGDTGVHALVWFGLILLVRMPERWLASRRHRRRGTCARCGYDCSATPLRCPECGTPGDARRPIWRPAVGAPAGIALVGAMALVAFAAVGRSRFEPEESAVERAARFGDLDAVRAAVAAGAAARDVGFSACWAAAHDQRDVVRAIISFSDAVVVNNVIRSAIWSDHTELAHELLSGVSDADGWLTMSLVFAALDSELPDLAAELFASRPCPDPAVLLGTALRSAPPDLVRRLVVLVEVEDFDPAGQMWCGARPENLEILIDHLASLDDDWMMSRWLAIGLREAHFARRTDLCEVYAAHLRRRIDAMNGIGVGDGMPAFIAALWRAGRPDLIVGLIDRLRTTGALDAVVVEVIESTSHRAVMALVQCGVDVVAGDPDGARIACDDWEEELIDAPLAQTELAVTVAAVRARLAEFDAASAGGAGEPRGR
ncbi:MAG: hypothetical protein KDA25_01570 [Phycisphaerales bacterium]|nr:hypothetical protein [Phycisphaerales bacterium]